LVESLENKEELNRNKILLENLKLKPEKQQLIFPTLQGFDVVKTEDIVGFIVRILLIPIS
jgi:two-component system LytT family response regulator